MLHLVQVLQPLLEQGTHQHLELQAIKHLEERQHLVPRPQTQEAPAYLVSRARLRQQACLASRAQEGPLAAPSHQGLHLVLHLPPTLEAVCLVSRARHRQQGGCLPHLCPAQVLEPKLQDLEDLVRTLQHLQDCLEEVNKHQLFLVTQVLVQVLFRQLQMERLSSSTLPPAKIQWSRMESAQTSIHGISASPQ